MSEPSPQPAPVAATSALSLAAGLLALVGLASLGYGGIGLAAAGLSRAEAGSAAGILLIGYGILLLVAAHGVRRGRRWSRAPAIATQLLQVPVAFGLGGGATWWFALLLGAVSVTVIICLLLPSSTAVFVADAERADPPEQGDQADPA